MSRDQQNVVESERLVQHAHDFCPSKQKLSIPGHSSPGKPGRAATRLAAAVLLGALAGAVGAGEIYTWKDKEGRINYADNPPPAPNTPRVMNAPGATPMGASQPGKTVADEDLEFRKRRAEAAETQAKADKTKAETDDRQKNCDRARSNLNALESGQRLVRYKDNGEREFLDDAARDAEAERMRKLLADNCK